MRWGQTVLLALTALFSAAPAAAKNEARNWLRADTHNFIIYSSGSRKELEAFATKLEKFDAMLRLSFGFSANEKPHRLAVYMLSTQQEVAQMNGEKPKDSWLGGYYMARRDGSFAVSNREAPPQGSGFEPELILFHEYAHHVTFHELNFPYPAWFVEGFAEYLSTVTFERDGTAMLGKPANHRAYALFDGEAMSVETVLYGDRSKFTNDQRDVFYGNSWLLVHYLRESPKRTGQLNAYLKAIAMGKQGQAAAEEAFGDLGQLDRDMRLYLKGKLAAYKTLKPLAYRTEVTITPLDPVQSQLVVLTARRKTGKDLAAVRDDLTALAAAAPQSAAVWLELAMAEYDLHRRGDGPMSGVSAAAEAAVDRALAADPGLARANALKAELTFYRLRDAGDDNPASWRAARALLAKANAADPEDPYTLYNWYQSYTLERRDPPKLAYDALAQAFDLQPEVPEIRGAYAIGLARQGQYGPALALANLMAQNPHDPQYGQALYKQIEMMREYDEQRKAAEAERATAPPAPPKPPARPRQRRN